MSDLQTPHAELPLPHPDAVSAAFWDGCRRGVLELLEWED